MNNNHFIVNQDSDRMYYFDPQTGKICTETKRNLMDASEFAQESFVERSCPRHSVPHSLREATYLNIPKRRDCNCKEDLKYFIIFRGRGLYHWNEYKFLHKTDGYDDEGDAWQALYNYMEEQFDADKPEDFQWLSEDLVEVVIDCRENGMPVKFENEELEREYKELEKSRIETITPMEDSAWYIYRTMGANKIPLEVIKAEICRLLENKKKRISIEECLKILEGSKKFNDAKAKDLSK